VQLAATIALPAIGLAVQPGGPCTSVRPGERLTSSPLPDRCAIRSRHRSRFMFNEPNGFVGSFIFRNTQDEQGKPILANYIIAGRCFARKCPEIQRATADI